MTVGQVTLFRVLDHFFAILLNKRSRSIPRSRGTAKHSLIHRRAVGQFTRAPSHSFRKISTHLPVGFDDMLGEPVV
jgi:hypothetical protein